MFGWCRQARFRVTAALTLLSTHAIGYAQVSPQPQLLAGVIDIHAHYAPDVTPRSVDALAGAREAQQMGMRAIVLKNHYTPTADQAWMVRQIVPGIEVFGGIALNLSVGGMNPDAVERMAQMQGGYGRIVWMDSFDSEAQVRSEHGTRPFVAVSHDGHLLPETVKVIAVIAKYHLAMGTGHNTPEEDLMLIEEARKQGVSEIVVTHAMMAPIHMTIPQMQKAAGLGAYIEFVYNGTVGKFKEFSLADYAKAIRAVGVDHCILASDLGQVGNPTPVQGLIAFFAGLRELGFTEAEIATMSKTNPAKLLALN